jgi:hypothetical protein
MGEVDETRRGRSCAVVPCRGAGRQRWRGAGSVAGPWSRSRSVTRGRGVEETGAVEEERRQGEGGAQDEDHRQLAVEIRRLESVEARGREATGWGVWGRRRGEWARREWRPGGGEEWVRVWVWEGAGDGRGLYKPAP